MLFLATDTVQLELGTLQLLAGVILINLGGVEFIGEHNNLVIRSPTSIITVTRTGLVRIVGILKIDRVAITGATNHSAAVQLCGVFNDNVLALGNTLNHLQIVEGNSDVIIGNLDNSLLGDVRISIVLDLVGGEIHLDVRIRRCVKSGIQRIVEDVLIGVVVGHVRNGTNQVERHLVSDIVIGGVIVLSTVSCLSGGLDVLLDLLLDLGNILLGLQCSRSNNLGQMQRKGITLLNCGRILEHVVASGQLCRSVLGDCSCSCRASEINVLVDLILDFLIRPTGQICECLHRGLIDAVTNVHAFGTLRVSTPLEVRQSASILRQSASEHLVGVIGVGITLVNGNRIGIRRHGGGGTGETGDGHCRGGCHSDEALENLIHCSPFLSCLKS